MASFYELSDRVLTFEEGCKSYPTVPQYVHPTLGADFDDIAEKTFTFEGGYQADPKDSANYNSRKELIGTNRGISAIAYEQYLKRPPTVADIKAITETIAKKVYKTLFWDAMQGDRINNDSVAHIMFDSYIATGNLKLVRQGINLVAGPGTVTEKNTKFNDYTVGVVNKQDQQRLFQTIKQLNIDQRKRLAEEKPEKYGHWLKGWLARLDKITFSGAAAIGAGFFLFWAQALFCG